MVTVSPVAVASAESNVPDIVGCVLLVVSELTVTAGPVVSTTNSPVVASVAGLPAVSVAWATTS